MLPDFKRTKKLIKDQTSRILEERTLVHMGGFGKIPRRKVHEGSGFIIEYDDGMRDDSELKPMKSKVDISLKDVLKDPRKVYEESLEKLAIDQAFQQSTMIVDKVSDITEKVGNVYDFRGTFTASKFIESLQGYEMSFAPDGRPIMPSIFSGPKLIEDVKKVFKEIDDSPELKRQWEELIQKQRKLSYDRAAARKLVD